MLIILDGFGYKKSVAHNAIAAANTPFLDELWQKHPNCLIATSGASVGLPDGQMGNSEVGHMNLGAGRIVYQDFTRITKAIADGDFFSNPALCGAIEQAVKNNKNVHIMGLLSDGGVHSHQDHLLAAVKLAVQKGARQIYIHAFLDGRDTPPKSAAKFIAEFEQTCAKIGGGKIASIVGRYFAMDRDNRWNRIADAYHLISKAQAKYRYTNTLNAINAAYKRGETDEFVAASIIGKPPQLQNGDALIFMNFRADRAREADFTEFKRQHFVRANFVMLTQYAADYDAPVAFMPNDLRNVFGEYLAANGKTQLRISETEKYAHVTFFFSGGREQPFDGEKRLLIPSPKVKTYDLQPQMSALLITEQICQSLQNKEFDVIIVNFANCDMVGHTGNFAAAVKAVESVDNCLHRISQALAQNGGQALITADHGNVEQMFDEQTGQAHTAHTCEPVPLFYLGDKKIKLKNGSLADIAPTLLHLMNLPKPLEMSGVNLAQDLSA